MNRADILATASQYVTQDRNTSYGGPEDNFTRIADLWSAYLRHPVSPTDVAAMMALLKIARIAANPQHLDSWTDGCGYLACGGELATRDQQ